MVAKNKINIKLLIFIGLILVVIVGVALAINFYNPTPTPTAGKGPILNWVCKGPVNDAVNAANSQCNAKVNDANKKCTDAVVVTQKILMDLSVGRLSTPFKIDIDLPAKTASANIAGEPNGKIALPILINGTFIVDWGDGWVKDSLLTHVYKMPGKYTITVYTLPNAITTVSLTLNKAGNYLTYKDQSGTDRTYITKIVTGNNSPSMNTFTSGGDLDLEKAVPEDWGIVVENNACPTCPKCPNSPPCPPVAPFPSITEAIVKEFNGGTRCTRQLVLKGQYLDNAEIFYTDKIKNDGVKYLMPGTYTRSENEITIILQKTQLDDIVDNIYVEGSESGVRLQYVGWAVWQCK